jgi:hypothetical protein
MALTDAGSGAKILGGTIPIEITLAADVTCGDLLGYSTGWVKALATTGTAIQAVAVAGADGLNGKRITAFFGDVHIKGRFSGNTIGGAVYGAEGTSNGHYTQTKPTTGGDCNTKLGIAVADDEVILRMNADALTVG